MKHVWILNHYAIEPGGAGGTRHYYLARNLVSHGWEATILAASTELNTSRQRLDADESCRLDRFDGVPFLWLRAPEYRGNKWGRVLNMLAYCWQALRPSNTRDLSVPDVIIGSSVHPFAAVVGAILAARLRVPFVFEVRDLWPQTLVDLGRLREDSLPARAMYALERWLYRRAQRIIVLLPRAVDYIAPLGIPVEKVVWIPNGVDLSAFPPPPPPPAAEPFTLMYFGAHGQANGLDNVLQAMAVLQTRLVPVRLRMIGEGPLKPALVALAESLGLRNVVFEAPVPKSQIPALASEADAFVFNLVNAPVFRYGISSNKLFDFMAGARPVLFCCEAANNPVLDAGCGVTVPPGNPTALADAVTGLLALPANERAAMGRAGRHYVEQCHGFERLGARLADMLDELVEK